MNNIGILHLSDIHFCEENLPTISHLLKLLETDIEQLSSDAHFDIHAVCITGDLINMGSKHEEEFNLFIEKFYLPLLSFLHLKEDAVFIVPGNHEIDASQIDELAERGITSWLTSSETINELMYKNSSTALTRIQYFQDINGLLCSYPMSYSDSFCRCYNVNINGINFGFACLNSAWRSSGKGDVERGKMIIGQSQVENALNHINDAHIKVCLVHHPLDWLLEYDKFDVEKALSKFDIVLNGHVHALDSKSIVAHNGATLINTCGRFFPSKDFYNGYSIISIEPNTFNVTVYLRQYYSHPRDCFDKCLQLYDDGIFGFNVASKDPVLISAFEITHDLQPGFTEYANSFFISNIITPHSKKSLEEAYIVPPLGKKSEYQKETMLEIEDYHSFNRSNGFYSIDALLSKTKKNLLILGRKEYGKTTLVHYMVNTYLKNYSIYGVVPFIINCSEDFSGKCPIEKKSEKFLLDFGTESLSIKLENIIALAEKGICVFFFENFETAGKKEIEKIKHFVEKYPNNRFIFSAIETIDTDEINQSLDVILPEVTRVFIHSLGKHQVRNLAQNLIGSDTSINENIVDKTMLCFKNTNLPKTPFIVSLVLSICQENADFVPINESVVMENFLEAILEKSSTDSAKTSSYDFKIKEDFLCYLVGKMHEANRYYFTQQEFEALSQEYHSQKGWAKNDTKFDVLFFKKGILYQHASMVAFRYSCIANFYLAKLALKEPDLLSHILDADNYLDYYYELNYLTGLERNCQIVISSIGPKFQALLQEYKPFLSELLDYNIKNDFAIEPSNLNAVLSNRLTKDQTDVITDDRESSRIIDSSKISKNPEKIDSISSTSKFLSSLIVYATILKNSELLDLSIKQTMVSNLTDGFCIALAILKKSLEDNRPRIIKEIEKIAEDSPDHEELPSEKVEEFFEDMMKIALPIAVENVAFENAGSAKLKNIILPLLQNDDFANSFSQYILLFLYCDLRIPDCLSVLQKFVNRTTSKDLLTISLFKILYYYKMRYFPPTCDKILVNLLADINLKLNNHNKHQKSLVIREIQKEKRIPIAKA